MADLPAQTIINGISSTVIFGLAMLMAFSLIQKYIKDRKKLIPPVALMGLCMGCFYLGGTVSFLSIVISGTNISYITAGQLSYTAVPIAITSAVFLGFTLFKPKLVKKGTLLYFLTSILYFIALYAYPYSNIKGEEPGLNEMTDTGLKFVVFYVTIFYIATLLFVIVLGFYNLSKRIDGHEKRMTQYIALGFFIFSIASVVEILTFGPYIIIPRIMTACSYFLLYKGFVNK